MKNNGNYKNKWHIIENMWDNYNNIFSQYNKKNIFFLIIQLSSIYFK